MSELQQTIATTTTQHQPSSTTTTSHLVAETNDHPRKKNNSRKKKFIKQLNSTTHPTIATTTALDSADNNHSDNNQSNQQMTAKVQQPTQQQQHNKHNKHNKHPTRRNHQQKSSENMIHMIQPYPLFIPQEHYNNNSFPTESTFSNQQEQVNNADSQPNNNNQNKKSNNNNNNNSKRRNTREKINGKKDTNNPSSKSLSSKTTRGESGATAADNNSNDVNTSGEQKTTRSVSRRSRSSNQPKSQHPTNGTEQQSEASSDQQSKSTVEGRHHQKNRKPKAAKKRVFNDPSLAEDNSTSGGSGGAFTSRGAFDKMKNESQKLIKRSLRNQSKNDNDADRTFNSLTERLIHTLSNQSHECVICMERVKAHMPTWSCATCFDVFHLRCVAKWARESIKDRSVKGQDTWICPSCQSVSSVIPQIYYCFCKKHVDPSPNMFLTPHSCGEECGKRRADPKCTHHCNLLCHPGQCPPCVASRDEDCYCGKFTFEVQCSEVGTKGISCEQTCERLLNCKRHHCTEMCHAGPCAPCDCIIEQGCYCGKDVEMRLCTPCPTEEKDEETGVIRTFSCEGPCPRTLVCGHQCDRICHEGKCIKHKNAWDKSAEADEDIDEFVRVSGCMQQCKAKLPCGHICRKKCHPTTPCIDETSQCKEKIRVFCSCGRLNEMIDCHTLHKRMQEKFSDSTIEDFRSLPPLVECDKECKKIARIKKLAYAFDIDYEKHEMPEYSQALQEFAKKNTQFIKMVEDKFDELLFDEKYEFKCYQFKSMPQAKRSAIHEMAEKYLMEAQSLDREPHRSVSVLKMKRSCRPAILLSEVIGDSHKLLVLQQKLQEKEEEELRQQEQLLQDRMRKKEERTQQKESQQLDVDYEQPVFASENEFDIIQFRHAQATKTAYESNEQQSEDTTNMWSSLVENEIEPS